MPIPDGCDVEALSQLRKERRTALRSRTIRRTRDRSGQAGPHRARACARRSSGKGVSNGIEAARKANGNSGLPHTLAHVQFADPVLWASAEEDTIELVKPHLDPALYQWQYPARSLLDNGAIVSGASDWPVSSANVFLAIYQAETRKGPAGVLDLSQRMPREAMFYAYKRNSALAMNQQDIIGSIAPGKQADLVLVDHDVLTVSPEELRDTKVIWTMEGGKTVYHAK
ncbi:MAG: hypothetical protein DMG69_33080 [Acidobacteria bacterium]|nr:MAG: hypothetical protein DMG69_33080 [Acidobacteriota bacterium]